MGLKNNDDLFFNGDRPDQGTGDGGLSQSQIAQKDAAWRKQRQDENLQNDSHAFKVNRINDENTYQSPGAADVGGGVGGAKVESDFFKGGMSKNDPSQQANAEALSNSLEAMRTGKGATLSPENARLLAKLDAARNQQGSALDMARDAAAGRAPSASDQQMSMSMDQNMAQAAGNAGSARGLSGLGGAQTMGAQATGMAGTSAAMSGGMGRSKEIGDAMGLYGSGANAMAQGDIDRLSQSNKNIFLNQKLKDDWRVGNAGLAVQQGGLANNQAVADDAWFNQSQDPYKRQFEYDQRMNAMQNGAGLDAAASTAAARKQREDANRALIKGGVAAGATAVGSLGGPLGAAGGGMAGSAINNLY